MKPPQRKTRSPPRPWAASKLSSAHLGSKARDARSHQSHPPAKATKSAGKISKLKRSLEETRNRSSSPGAGTEVIAQSVRGLFRARIIRPIRRNAARETISRETFQSQPRRSKAEIN